MSVCLSELYKISTINFVFVVFVYDSNNYNFIFLETLNKALEFINGHFFVCVIFIYGTLYLILTLNDNDSSLVAGFIFTFHLEGRQNPRKEF